MPNYYTQASVQPEIPLDLLDQTARERLESCGFVCVETPKGWYLYADEQAGADQDDVSFEAILQEVIRKSDHRLKYLTVEAAMSCSQPHPIAFGGFAYIITASAIRYMSTGAWLEDNTPWDEQDTEQSSPIHPVRIYCSPLLGLWRVELDYGHSVHDLSLDEAAALADEIKRQLAIHQAAQQTTSVQAQPLT